FFFSSRRRHTRWPRDWSSDVCSSDLSELYDAAKVDGANAFYRFFKISIPMISPVIFYNLVLATIAAFQYFLTAYVIYQNTAGPNNSALFYMMNLYKNGFVYYHMGYASALAWGLFIVGLAIT